MDSLQNEIAELKQFIVDLKADRAATKEKEARESWTKYVSLSVVIIAVFAAIAAQWGGKYGSGTQLSQAQASDRWAFYQAKSIKQHLFETARAQNHNAGDADSVAKFDQQVARYEKEKAEIKAQAEELEKLRDESGRRGRKMGMAISLFSVSIAIASICLVTKKKPLWFVSLILAAGAVLEMILAWTS